MIWSLALRPDDDAKQDPVVYGTRFGVVFLAEGPRTASIQKGFDCLGLYHSDLEGERDFRLVVELLVEARSVNKCEERNSANCILLFAQFRSSTSLHNLHYLLVSS